MVAVEICFPTRRFHATPADHHVNEGLVEWPPSPWRFSRALVATGFRALGWPPDEPPEAARELLADLAEASPTYILPPAPGRAETRSYVPAGTRRVLLVDAFCVLRPGDRIVLRWPLEIPPDRLELLDALLLHLPYLGRSESWVEARRVEGAARPGELEMAPASPERPTPDDAEPLELLAPLPSRALAAWRRAGIEEARAGSGAAGARRAARQFPSEVWRALLVGTERIVAERWSEPPGSQRVAYDLPRAAKPLRLEEGWPWPIGAEARPGLGREPHLYLALRPHPPIAAVLGVAERLHARAAASAGARDPDLRARLLGVDANGQPIRGHRHLHLVPHRRGRRLEGLLAHLPAGHTEATRAVLLAVAKGEEAIAPPELLGPGRTWRSSTPFLLLRHPRRGAEGPEAQLRLEIARRGLPPPDHVRAWPSREVRGAGFFAFSRSRRAEGRGAPLPRPYGFDLRFSEPVSGPLALGYGAHFGLGSFAADVEADET